MRTDLFDFDLPDDLIALEPATPRDAARLLVVRPAAPSPRAKLTSPQAPDGVGPLAPGPGADPKSRNEGSHRAFAPHPNALPASRESEHHDGRILDLPEVLRPGDALVLNDTRVIRAALQGERIRGSNRAVVSFNLHKRLNDHRWLAFARPAKRLATGDRIRFGHDGRVCLLGTLDAVVARMGDAGEVELAFSLHGAYLDEAVEALGDPPLPPYIVGKRAVEPADADRYQTIYARREGAVAAPTAGLHFTDGLLAALDGRGVTRHCVTLHVGAGTFLPVKAEETSEHR